MILVAILPFGCERVTLIVPAGIMKKHGSIHRAVIPAGMPGSKPGMASLQPPPNLSGLDDTLPPDIILTARMRSGVEDVGAVAPEAPTEKIGVQASACKHAGTHRAS